jgi:MFS transporter, MHS family, shikimate and dehydroshikimate transport protein
MKRIVLSSIIGTAVEWYDFLIYGIASALVFNKLFFPLSDPALGTIAAFGTYGVGFLARPLGAAIFGHFGDRVGRKAMLAITIVIMGLGTFLIGLLPTYGQIGVAAPIALVVLRLLQGIGLGGEWGGAVLMVVENASTMEPRAAWLDGPARLPDRESHRHRGAGGVVAAAGGGVPRLGMAYSISHQHLPRRRRPLYPHAARGDAGVRKVEADRTTARMPIVEVVTKHPRAFFTAVGLKLSEISYVSIATVFAISYVTNQLSLPRSVILNAVLLSAVVGLFVIPLFGWLSDKLGRKTLFYASCAFAIAFAFPMFWLLDTKDAGIITLTILAAITFGQLIGFGVGAPWYSELFSARLRYSGASLGFQIGAAISGGLTPFAAAAFVAWTGGPTWPISVYLIALAMITLVATMAAPETAGKPLK